MWLRAVIYELFRALLTDTDFYVFIVSVVGILLTCLFPAKEIEEYEVALWCWYSTPDD